METLQQMIWLLFLLPERQKIQKYTMFWIPKLQDFEKALHRLTLNLSKQIVVDGEGAKKFITIKVIGARSTTMAKNIGFSIANSPLFKTAIAGEDPNWGRIVMGIGKSGENITPNKVQIKIGDYLVAEQSKTAKDYKESDVKEYMKWDSINIEVNLNIGNAFIQFTRVILHMTI